MKTWLQKIFDTKKQLQRMLVGAGNSKPGTITTEERTKRRSANKVKRKSRKVNRKK